MRSRSINFDTREDGEEQSPDSVFSSAAKLHSENHEAPAVDRKVAVPATAAPDREVKEAEEGDNRQDGNKEEQGASDRLFIHLRDNMETIREFCKSIMQHIPTPEQCVIEGNVHNYKTCLLSEPY